jgi:formyl-CoA transferase
MGGAPERTGLQHGFIAPYGAFICKNEEQVLLSIQNNREWAEFCSIVLQQPELIDDIRFCSNPERFKNRVELDALVNKCFSKYDKKSVITLLEKASIANATLNSVADLSNHPFLKNAVAQTGGKEIYFAALPIHTVAISSNEVPTLGQHSNLIKSEFFCKSDSKHD